MHSFHDPAPTLDCYDNGTHYLVYCKYCETFHQHPRENGYYEPVCEVLTSDYLRSGYLIMKAGKIERTRQAILESAFKLVQWDE